METSALMNDHSCIDLFIHQRRTDVHPCIDLFKHQRRTDVHRIQSPNYYGQTPPVGTIDSNSHQPEQFDNGDAIAMTVPSLCNKLGIRTMTGLVRSLGQGDRHR